MLSNIEAETRKDDGSRPVYGVIIDPRKMFDKKSAQTRKD